MPSRTPFYLLIATLFVLGLGLTIHRHIVFEVPWTPGEQRQIWAVDAKIEFQAEGLTDQEKPEIKTEIAAGITAFLTMAYIVVVNPTILSAAGMPSSDVFFATCVSSAIATVVMALWARYPFSLAPGMGRAVGASSLRVASRSSRYCSGARGRSSSRTR